MVKNAGVHLSGELGVAAWKSCVHRPQGYVRAGSQQSGNVMRHAFFASTAFIGSAMIALASPVVAQTSVEGRVDRLEKEMRAVQRKLFPAGTPIEKKKFKK